MSVPSVPRCAKGDGNTRVIPHASKHWCFTLNNYLQEDINSLCANALLKKYVFQEETGKEGTRHLQGYLEFEKKNRPLTVFKNKNFHWEKCRNIDDSILYCQKEDTRTGQVFIKGFPKKRIDTRFDNAVLKDWQKELVEKLKVEPNDRKVIWYYNSNGNIGKSWFCKWATRNLEACKAITCTKSADILMSADEYTRTYIFDFPRCLGDFCPYNAIEQMKNGLTMDAKLKKEVAICDFAPPHVVIFSNSYPDRSKLSNDRWEIITLD